MHKAMLYSRDNGQVKCELCAHLCNIKEGRRGICQVRQNISGDLYTLVYGKLIAENVDPIEKKPLFHVFPGTLSYSIATRGCNFRCLHCQNSSISQVSSAANPGDFAAERSPEQLIGAALAGGCTTLSYTYVEPTVFFEYAYDCCQLAVEHGLRNVFVSNGYLTDKSSQLLAPFLTGINIDLKSYSDTFYKEVCGARLQPVLDTIARMLDLGVWLEVTTLLIPGYNDSDQELQAIAGFLAGLDGNIPWHVSAFYPTYKLTNPPPTPRASIERARDIGLQAGLKYVYEGNIAGSRGANTPCPGCGSELILRSGYTIRKNRLQAGCCYACNQAIPGVWG